MASEVNYPVIDKDGKEIGTIALDSGVFGFPVDEFALHQVVRWQLNKKRAGTHSTKNIAAMEGGGRKPHKQKGTGKARAGSNNSPLWIGGAVAMGPTPRKYDFKIPKALRKNALCSALTIKAAEKSLIIVDNLEGNFTGKTKEAKSLLESVSVKEPKRKGKASALVILTGCRERSDKSLRNIAGVKTIPTIGVNVYDLMLHPCIVMSKQGVEELCNRINSKEA